MQNRDSGNHPRRRSRYACVARARVHHACGQRKKRARGLARGSPSLRAHQPVSAHCIAVRACLLGLLQLVTHRPRTYQPHCRVAAGRDATKRLDGDEEGHAEPDADEAEAELMALGPLEDLVGEEADTDRDDRGHGKGLGDRNGKKRRHLY